MTLWIDGEKSIHSLNRTYLEENELMHKNDMKREKAYRRKQRKNKIDAERFAQRLNKMCSEAKKVSESLREVKFKEV